MSTNVLGYQLPSYPIEDRNFPLKYSKRSVRSLELITECQPLFIHRQMENRNNLIRNWKLISSCFVLTAYELACQLMTQCVKGKSPMFKEGDMVWLDTRNLKTAHQIRKFSLRREGLFKIEKEDLSHAVTTTISYHSRNNPQLIHPPTSHIGMPSGKGSPKSHMRINYVTVTDNPTTTAVNQFLALLNRADALLRSATSLPDLDTQPLSEFFGQLERAAWVSFVVRDSGPAEGAGGMSAPKSSLELKCLARQVQAINSKLGALQAHIQKSTKSYTAAAASALPQEDKGCPAKPPHELRTRARCPHF